MANGTHAASTSTLLEPPHSTFQIQAASHSSAEAQATLFSTRGGNRYSSARPFVPMTPMMTCPLVTPLVASSSDLESFTSHTGSNINRLTIIGSANQVLDAVGDTTLSPPVVPPTLSYTPPTPPRPAVSHRYSKSSLVSYGRPVSQLSAPCLTYLPSLPSVKRSKSVSQLPKHCLCLSSPIPPSNAPCQSIQDRRVIKCSVVDFPAYNSNSSHLPAAHTTRPKNMFHLGSDDDDPQMAFHAHNLPLKETQNEDEPDGIRRYHAVMELLRTEAKYLFDLRMLVTIYLQQLPMATTTLRSPSITYFGTSSASNSVFRALPSPTTSAFGMASLPVVIASPVQRPTATAIGRRRSRSVTNGNEIEKDSLPRRRLFTEDDVALISRNAKDLLDFHDRLVEELKEAVAPLGPMFSFNSTEQDGSLDVPAEDRLNQVIQIIASRFIDQAPSFSIYRSFCSTHTEACELIQKTKQQYPVECAIWEKRCRGLVENLYRTESIYSEPIPPASPSSPGRESDCSPSLEAEPPPQNRPRSASYAKTPKPPIAPSPLSTAQTQSSRLMLMDYLIKPVQRICKYHLLLDQLKVKNPGPYSESYGTVLANPDAPSGVSAVSVTRVSQTDAVVALASNAMHEVVDSVNDDRRRHEYQFKSLLIASRMASPSLLSPKFMRSLGACLLAGALDVVYHRPSNSSSVKAKYLGTFLYVKGYLILAKVAKGKVYDPLHWFPLAGFEVVNKEEDDPCFPYSFHLTGKGHHFQFAAACQKEKEAWIEGFRECIYSTSEWTMEPVSSLRDEDRGDTVTPILATPATTFEKPSALPTIESLSELAGNVELLTPGKTSGANMLRRPRSPTRTGSEIRIANLSTKYDVAPKQDSGSSLSRSSSRRSSTASVKAIFSPFLFDYGTRIIRSSSLQRQNVELGLVDVFSDLCRDARSRAELHSMELFQIPKKAYPVIPRSTGSMATSGLRPKRDNKLISRRSYAGADSALAGDRVPRKQKTLSDLSYRKVWPVGTVVDNDVSMWNGGSMAPTPETFLDYSVCSSGETSGGRSSLSTPIEVPYTLPPSSIPADQVPSSIANSLSSAQWEFRPKRSQSMVENVRSFFTPFTSHRGSRTISTSINPTPDWRSVPDGDTLVPRASIRKRTQSTPIAASEQLSPSTRQFNHETSSMKSTPLTAASVAGGLQSEDRCKDVPQTLDHKRLSFLRPNTRRDVLGKPSTGPTGPTRRKSLKDILRHFRTNSFTPIST